MLNLKSISEEEADCRAAFAGVSVGALVLHCHHDVLLELLLEPAENRINCILHYKPKTEQALRLRLFRPLLPACFRAELDTARAEWVKADAKWADAEWAEAGAKWDRACAEWTKTGHHAAICPDCPWDGSTIFPHL